MAANELVNEFKQPLQLFTTAASSDNLVALKNIATIFETAASSRQVTNTKNISQTASVQLAPIHVPQPLTQQFSTYSTPVTQTTDLP